MPELNITFYQDKSMEACAKRFKKNLSQTQIDKIAARAINKIADKSVSMVQKEAKRNYTITPKYLERVVMIGHKARGNENELYTLIYYNFATLPLAAFRFQNMNPRDKFITFNSTQPGVMVEQKKGHSKLFKHAFVKTLKSGHTGIWGHGRYIGGKFTPQNVLTRNKKPLITEMRGASAFTMFTNRMMQEKLKVYMKENLVPTFEKMLSDKVAKMSNTV